MIDKNKTLRTAYYSNEINAIEIVVQYFESISGKKLKPPFLRQKLFKTKWKGSEVRTLARCHIQAAINYLNYLSSFKQVTEIKNELKLVIAEAIEYVNELDKTQDTSFILTSTNTLPSFAHFLNARELFYNHNIRVDYRNNYDCDVLVLYALRLTLEKRINGIIGIDFILNKENKPIPLSKIIGIIKNLKMIEFSPNISWEEIEGVNKWLNHFMHRNLRPHPWTIQLAIESLNEILCVKLKNQDKKVVSSWYSTSVVKNIAEFKSEVESALLKQFPDCLISWSSKNEVLIL